MTSALLVPPKAFELVSVGGVVLSTVTVLSCEQFWKDPVLIVVTFTPIVTDVSLVL